MAEKKRKKKRNIYRSYFEQTCAFCNKEFDTYPATANEWVFKSRIGGKKNYYCSYSCLRNHEKEAGIK